MIKWVDSVLTGLICGLAAPVLSLGVYCKINFPLSSFADQIQKFNAYHVLPHAVSLSVIANLLLFFIFIALNNDRSARGVLGATILYGLLIVFLKFS